MGAGPYIWRHCQTTIQRKNGHVVSSAYVIGSPMLLLLFWREGRRKPLNFKIDCQFCSRHYERRCSISVVVVFLQHIFLQAGCPLLKVGRCGCWGYYTSFNSSTVRIYIRFVAIHVHVVCSAINGINTWIFPSNDVTNVLCLRDLLSVIYILSLGHVTVSMQM